jgi:PHD/YefM family antitoxin component YafN of YafNO toxin-antitoxin module
MSVLSLREEPVRVDEPQAAEEYAAVLTRVVDAGRPLIVRRNGEDLAAVIPLEQLELLREIQLERLAHQEAEALATAIDWTRTRELGPPQSWFDDEADNPFEPEEPPTP